MRLTLIKENWDTLEKDFQGRLKKDEPLSQHSTLRIGGPARFWVEVKSLVELQRVVELANQERLPIEVVGLGSNVLFSDKGYDGVMLRLSGNLAGWNILDDGLVNIGAGAINAHLVKGLLKNGLVGAEFLVLIPGTFGGAIAKNAGTKNDEMSSILQSIQIITLNQPRKVISMSAAEINLSYRHADLPERSLVIGGQIQLKTGDTAIAAEKVREDKNNRSKTQPYKLKSVGSTFANPTGDYAGRLIEAVGLKGTRIGGARISEHHANFFINEENASSSDFLSLMAVAMVKVKEAFGVELRPEVCFVGFDGWSELNNLMKTYATEGSNG